MSTYATPKVLDIFDPDLNICAYCSKKTVVTQATKQLSTGKTRHIFHCTEHESLAERDIFASLHEEGRVRQQEAVVDPLFELLPQEFTLTGANGSPQTGWSLYKYPLASPEEDLIWRSDHETWVILLMLSKWDGPHYRTVPVKDLAKSLPEDQRGHVTEFISRLNAGIYKKSYELSREGK